MGNIVFVAEGVVVLFYIGWFVLAFRRSIKTVLVSPLPAYDSYNAHRLLMERHMIEQMNLSGHPPDETIARYQDWLVRANQYTASYNDQTDKADAGPNCDRDGINDKDGQLLH